MADNRIDGEVLGVAMDGLGYGDDGRLWGCEFLVADFAQAERVAHLDYIAMPGGAKAIREPWRMAAVYLHRAFGDRFLDLDLEFTRSLDKRAWQTLRRMIETRTNSPETSSMGRLFDAIASLVGLRNTVSYEGQAAIALEAIANESHATGYQFELSSNGTILPTPVVEAAAADLMSGHSAGEVSARFHVGVASLVRDLARRVRDSRGIDRVALSGGVFQNGLLANLTRTLLERDGFNVFTHGRVPPNDGGISLGQAAIANARAARRS